MLVGWVAGLSKTKTKLNPQLKMGLGLGRSLVIQFSNWNIKFDWSVPLKEVFRQNVWLSVNQFVFYNTVSLLSEGVIPTKRSANFMDNFTSKP